MIVPPLLYQDDVLLAFISTRKMQGMLGMAEDFQNRNLLKFNMEKSLCMHMNFDGRKSKVIEQLLKLNSNIIKRVETYKYLGDLKDTKILWKKALNIGEIL